MSRPTPYPVAGLQPRSGAFTVRQDGIGFGSAVGANYGPAGNRTPGLDGPATEPSASGTKYYVGDSGNDGNSGTSKTDAFRTFAPVSQGGSSEATSGDVVVVLGEGVTLNNSSDLFVCSNSGVILSGEDGTFPTIQSNVTDGSAAIAAFADLECRGFHLNGPADPASGEGIMYDSVYTGQSVPMSYSDAKNGGWVYNVKATRFGLPGIFFGEGGGGVVEKCHAAYNYGPAASNGTGGGNSDGVQFTSGPNDSDAHIGGWIIDTLVNHNSDDGIDLFRARGLVIQRCLAYANGYREDGSTTDVEAPGKGIKIGGDDGSMDIGGTLVQRCVSCENGGAGYGANGSNLAVDFLYCTAFDNAKKDGSSGAPDRTYENDFELFEASGGGPSGYNLSDSRLVGCIGQQGIYYSLQSGTIDSTNVITCNFDSSNNFDPAFGAIPFASNGIDGQLYPRAENHVGHIDVRETASSLPGIIDNGDTSYQPTPASAYHGITSVVDYASTAPDLGGYETTATGTTTSAYGGDGYGLGGYGET